eukprot:TRINITY_DN3793_c0_g1_i1.p1 TRINITY_DN3793_c0_g1~~TRINITY_DN3793_c0_g1_i1.p1  ORF type:complete len:924 (+),score=262.14 TRINITY_DN3793_c0_g1_i1:63-2834(+)
MSDGIFSADKTSSKNIIPDMHHLLHNNNGNNNYLTTSVMSSANSSAQNIPSSSSAGSVEFDRNSSGGGFNYGYDGVNAKHQPVVISSSSLKTMTFDYREIVFEELKLDPDSIGSGAFGVVYKGKWRGATVAVKKLLVDVMDAEVLALEVRREATVFQQVANHPNIVRFYGACTKKQPLCLITSLYPRGSVYSLIRKVKLEWSTIVGFARDAAAGISHLHAENVIHRDIATRNLLVDDQGVVRISDFGLARIKTKATSQTKSNVGPVKWMAPEAIKKKQFSVKSDSYSFGVLLWELVTRTEPYADMDPIHVAVEVIQDDLRPDIPEYTPKPFADIMLSCWATNPDDRPDMTEILETLQQYYDTLPQVVDTALLSSSTIITNMNNVGSGGISVISSISPTPPSPSTHHHPPPSSSGGSGSTFSSIMGPPGGSSFVAPDLECPICQNVFDIVVETPCCHVCYCKGCISDWCAKSGSCPDCRASINVEQLRPNVPLQRLCDNLPAECPYVFNGCTDRITRGIQAEHTTKCAYAPAVCPGLIDYSASANISSSQLPLDIPKCPSFLKKDLANHLQRDCPYRMVPCEMGCGASLRFFQQDLHKATCPNIVVPCPNNCGTDIRRVDIDSHIVTECPMQHISCDYASWGCAMTFPRRLMAKHCEDEAHLHLEFAKTIIDLKEKTIREQSEASISLQINQEKLSEENANLRAALKDLSNLKPKLPYHYLSARALLLPSRLTLHEGLDSHNTLATIEPEGREVTYTGVTRSFLASSKIGNTKPVLILSDRPTPTGHILYYFEVRILNLGKDGAIGIGFTGMGPDSHVMPGWCKYAYGYHGDDGKKFGFPDNQQGKAYGPQWAVNDVIGCGWDQGSKKIFFTYNGRYISVAFENVEGIMYPAIGLNTPGAKIKANFGQEQFKFEPRDFVIPRQL